jgi:digeranylgeranylglycerophospholipid reductase
MQTDNLVVGSYDVAVIGASVMGSFAAERMAAAGLRVALLEKDPFPGASTVCAGGMHVAVARFLAIPPEAIDQEDCSIRILHGRRALGWSFTRPVWLTANRRLLDRKMAERAEQAGAKLWVQSRVVEVRPKERSLLFRHGRDEGLRALTAQVFVFADGANTMARRLVEDSKAPRQGLRWAAVTWDLACSPFELTALEFYLDAAMIPFGYAWIFPKRTHLDVGLGRLAGIQGPPLPQLLKEFIRRDPNLRDRQVLAKRGGVIPAAVGPILQEDNWMVIGDAAGMVNPMTGGGYMSGLASAALAAEVCVAAFHKGQVNTRALRRYRTRLKSSANYVHVFLLNIILRAMVRVYALTGLALYPLAFLVYEWIMMHIPTRLGMRFLQHKRQVTAP